MVEIDISTKSGYEQLAILLWSLLEQDYKDWVVTIVDDSEDRKDIRELPYISPILHRLAKENHNWRVLFGVKKGPHYSHQRVIDESRHELILRVDDDCVLSAGALGKLVETMSKDDKLVGVAPVIVDPSSDYQIMKLPVGYRQFKRYQGKVSETGENFGDQQWRLHPDSEIQYVEHLYSSFLYKVNAIKEIGGYDLSYNVVGHREETDLTYRLFKKGYKLAICPDSLFWHCRNPQGGIRTYSNSDLWAECNERFLNKFRFKRGKYQEEVVEIFGGLGDHLCASALLRGLRRSGKKVIVTSVYPYIFQGNKNVDEILFSEDKAGYENIKFVDIYKWGFENNVVCRASELFCRAYGVEYDGDKLDFYNYPQEENWAKEKIGNDKVVMVTAGGGIPVIQYHGVSAIGVAKRRTTVKDWYKERWEKLVKLIKNEGYKVWQIGGTGEEKIGGCDRYVFGEDYRLAPALLRFSKGWISVDTFLGHAGAAVGKKGIVLFGASHPDLFGHDENVNIFHGEACEDRKCLHESELKFQWISHKESCESKRCMRTITVEEVFEGFLKLKNNEP